MIDETFSERSSGNYDEEYQYGVGSCS